MHRIKYITQRLRVVLAEEMLIEATPVEIYNALIRQVDDGAEIKQLENDAADLGAAYLLGGADLRYFRGPVMMEKWLDVLTDEQRELRKQKRYGEIKLTDEQKHMLGDEGCCWIESPSFYANSQWCT